MGEQECHSALAEHRFGAGEDTVSMIYISVAEELESGIIFQNWFFAGGNGIGGEIGYIFDGVGAINVRRTDYLYGVKDGGIE